jgi:hypothetical protein
MKLTPTRIAVAALTLAGGTAWAHGMGMGMHERMPMGQRMDMGSHKGMGGMGMHGMGHGADHGGCMQHGMSHRADGTGHRHGADAAQKAPSSKTAPAQDAATP